ncbi:hypothetical protein OT109_11425 [Phycisphaeraceae bacterium D3-23]
MKSKLHIKILRVTIVLFSAACLSLYVACQSRTSGDAQTDAADREGALLSGSKSRAVSPPNTDWLVIPSSKSAQIVTPEGLLDRTRLMPGSKSFPMEFDLRDFPGFEPEEDEPEAPYDGVDFETFPGVFDPPPASDE